MTFEWDIYKAIANVSKHGIGFQQAITAFDDRFHLILEDIANAGTDKKRYQIIGEIDPDFSGSAHRIVSVIYTIREPEQIYRLISARAANRVERRIYEIQKRP